ncbi:hypothetical protein Cpap_4177 [Ruminiclostridium papyrosolvens DSM 2782]|uniref:DUF4190 domain-containing protein n=1 Tax=Ruminiclostridium papyrosolvens DSM 2782 TaxID=588581 RepID=F1T8D7_9FIRM|nr:hypothetical protein [Ruminiclostridium papyrosolvens]EGD49735.1 hypothetical protein Cpap_4177 [Ruminiclostridium papyrosolvens DSM 2782]WES33138.1 hypothetical protein P0092_15395 [Ruminiclostridium papyrosolvens DSM 2782]
MSFSNNEPDCMDKARTSFILGIVDTLAWLLPIVGIPVSIVGLILGILGMKSTKRWMAVVGIILSSIFLVAAIINVIIGALNKFYK